MIGAFNNYKVYRRNGMRHAWRYSGMNFVVAKLLRGLGYLVFVLMFLYLISDKANAIGEAADNRVATKISNQAVMINELSRYLERCLQEGENPIWIGDKLYFCGMTDTGERR